MKLQIVKITKQVCFYHWKKKINIPEAQTTVGAAADECIPSRSQSRYSEEGCNALYFPFILSEM